MKITARVGMSLFLVISIVHCTWPALAQSPPTSMDDMLDALPISQDAIVSDEYPGFQSVLSIGENMERLYGVGSVYEVRQVPKRRPLEKNDKYVPILVSPYTTLREYLDHMCSEEQMNWDVVHNAIHIWPTAVIEGKETYLDKVWISLDLQGSSLLDAAKAWATEVNRNRTPGGYGVRVRHTASGGGMRGYHATPECLTRPGAVTLKLNEVTAREALCAIQGMSREWIQITYMHLTNRQDSVRLHVSNEDRIATAEITYEERQALNAQENLDAVLVEPEAKE